MFFSPEDVQHLQTEYGTVEERYGQLLRAYMTRRYNEELAREHARHGFCRRLQVLVRCIDNIFQGLPPDLDRLPTEEELSDTNINLQAFIFNVFGCAENLAWIWVHERNLRMNNGEPLPRLEVGLRQRNQIVRRTFSPDFQATLVRFDDWFNLNDEYRHAVAHRIPLYVPPYIVTDEAEADHRELEGRKAEALNQGAFDEYDRLSAAQDNLGEFRPIMVHSIAEAARPVIFHSQLLADFNTVDALARGLLEELDRE